MPDFLSPHSKDLISNILNADPSKRFTIEQIRKHPWYNQVEPIEKVGVFLNDEKIKVNEELID